MLKPFMRPSSGEGVYVPRPEEAANAFGVFYAYVGAALEAEGTFDMIVPDSIVPGEIDATLSLYMPDGYIAVIGEPQNSRRSRWVLMPVSSLLMRYVCMPGNRTLHRIDQSSEDALRLDQIVRETAGDKAMQMARKSVTEVALETGILPNILVGEAEADGLVDYLRTGEPFVP